ncbi:serine hydrolase [Moheibacter sediminis]|uniref:CubicO group peptidase, beta-lactamase class C family n=1 Tax=Moheibacter sediminis TaxID=1434700 RepID=A0A1W2B403_9FLAO|nr:serine hydrolase [Moheibacter sediminis]SMC67669.1 CubicO group peptidase, beta-lactamase class C family [Moheibacter sediminis]
MSKTILFFLVLISTATFSQNNKHLDKDIYSIIDGNAETLLLESKAYSVSIGIVKNGKIYTKHYGEIDKGKANKANNDTYFEIASVTKVMTGYLLAKAVLEKKVNLNDDIRKYLKGDYRNLEFNEKSIHINDLISYESAIPSVLPDDREIMKTFDDSTTFKLVELTKNYTKPDFLRDLKKIKLDSLPGTKYLYSNPSLELTGLILENIYEKPFEELLRENLWSKLKMNHTKFALNANEQLANGYNSNHILMPHFVSNLWGSSGLQTKSTLGDLMQFLQFELESQNKTVQETQRNVKNSKQNWFGYFWDNIYISELGKYAYKHGGAYGNQVMFSVFPEQNLGVCIVVNISGPETHRILSNSTFHIANDLLTNNNSRKNVYGYRLTNDKVIFTYQHNQKANADLINHISVAGSFNDWNPENSKFQMVVKGNNLFELELPKSQFEKNKEYQFKFVINNSRWITSPKHALNNDQTPDNNLTLKIE